MSSLAAFDPLISAKSLLTHAFYQRWSKGELTLDELKVYAKEYFFLVQRIPGIVSRIQDRAEDRLLKTQIDQNVQEETEHIDLWVRFAKSLGIEENELRDYEPSQKVRSAVKQLEDLAEEGLQEGVSAMYAMERELPAIAATKKQGLCDFYGLISEDAHIYFDEHLNEANHFGVWLSVDVDPVKAESVIEKSLAAQHQVLDAVCEECGIGMVNC